ncbi:hypothetical protein LUZ60_013121 [Juncus effusus]|nr:hypothetical protein LUZ60_013121 [Juncus effusus]
MGTEIKGSILMDKYEIGRMLGQGTFAKVYYGKNLSTNQSVAIKVIDKEKISKFGLMDQIKREITVMNVVRHVNIVQLYEVLATKSKIYFVLEYIKGGELFNKVSKGRLREETARKYFQQLISAVDFCHSRKVYHRDLKPENLLLDENGNLKVSDFGLSALSDSKRVDGLLHTTCGTPAYVAPEVINRKGYCGAKADIWSCGVILFVLLAGYLPFHDANLMEMYKKIGRADFKFPHWFSSDVKKLLMRILDPNPNTRISIQRIMENPWFRKNFDDKSIKRGININYKNNNSVEIKEIGCNNENNSMEGKISNLNAFDIISLSAGFDLSGLFEETNNKKEERFTSSKSASVIMSKMEEIGKKLRLKVRKKEEGVVRMEGVKEGRKGVLGISAEIFEVTPEFHLVEMKKTSGDTLEYRKMWKQDVRPALKDIVWAWQGEQAAQVQAKTTDQI